MWKSFIIHLKTIFNYPTLEECYRVAALDVFN